MSQQNNKFTAFWMDTTTAPGVPLTGLSATINIRDINGNLVVNNQPMTELGGGHYIYTFTGYNPAVDYVYDCNPGSTAYIESGVTNNFEQLISEIRVGGGGGFSSQGIQTYIGNLGRRIDSKIEEEHEKTRELIKSENNDTNSHIDIAKDEVIATIDSIETDIDTTDIVRGLGVIKTQNTKLATYLKSEKDSEISEIEKKHKKMMEEMEKAYAEMEEYNEKIVSEKEKEKESIMKDADEIIESLEGEIKTAGENAIAEIKTLLK